MNSPSLHPIEQTGAGTSLNAERLECLAAITRRAYGPAPGELDEPQAVEDDGGGHTDEAEHNEEACHDSFRTHLDVVGDKLTWLH